HPEMTSLPAERAPIHARITSRSKMALPHQAVTGARRMNVIEAISQVTANRLGSTSHVTRSWGTVRRERFRETDQQPGVQACHKCRGHACARQPPARQADADDERPAEQAANRESQSRTANDRRLKCGCHSSNGNCTGEQAASTIIVAAKRATQDS